MQHSDEAGEIARLIAIVTGERMGWQDREAAVERLVELGEPAVVPLIQALEEDPFGRRTETLMRALGQLRDPRAVEPLLAALSQVNPHVRQDAATALGLIGDPQAIGPLINAFRVESGDIEDIGAWQDAAEALAQFGAPALGPLVAALTDESDNVRTWSPQALGQLGDPRAVGPLLVALGDSEPQVRMEAAVALGQIGDQQAIDAVVTLLNDPNQWVRLYGVRALGDLVTGEVFAPLVTALDDPAVEVRCEALRALAESAGPRALDLLLSRTTDPHPCVRYSAVAALGEVGDEPLISLLERIERHDHGRCHAAWVRESARYAIECIKERHGIPPP